MCHAGRRKEIAQPRNNGCGGWQTSEGSKGEQRDFPMAKIPPTALGRCWHQGRECKGTARHSGQCPGVRASCTARYGTARCARAVPSSLHSPCVAHAARTSPIQLRGTAGDNRSHLPAAGLALPRRTPNAGEQQRQRSQGSGTPQCQAGRASKGARPR